MTTNTDTRYVAPWVDPANCDHEEGPSEDGPSRCSQCCDCPECGEYRWETEQEQLAIS